MILILRKILLSFVSSDKKFKKYKWKHILFLSFLATVYAAVLHLPSNVKAGREHWGRGKLGRLEEENYKFGNWQPLEQSLKSIGQPTTTTTTSKF
jgi:hypothetical protein